MKLGIILLIGALPAWCQTSPPAPSQAKKSDATPAPAFGTSPAAPSAGAQAPASSAPPAASSASAQAPASSAAHAAASGGAQSPASGAPPAAPSARAAAPASGAHHGTLSREEEERMLQDAVSQVGNSPIDFIRAAERHLRKYPQTPRREDLERAILKAAIDAKDNPRIILYGEKILQQDNDLVLLDRVARALLASDDPDSSRRALQYSQKLEKATADWNAQAPQPEKQDEFDRNLARARVLEARSWGNVGELDKAVAQARKSYDTYPTGEAAAEMARWEVKLGRLREAVEHYADAFAIPDPNITQDNRRHDRKVLGEIYAKLNGSETGLGDLVLKAYDRTAEAVRVLDERRNAAVPNAGLQDAFQFRLTGLRGDSVRLGDFHGKVLVLDFWATWCGPCRFQHPMIEKLKSKYKNHHEVAFLSIDTDQDRSLVKPFIEELQWSDQVYFEDGLAQFYRINSIPTTMIFNKRGEMVSRLPGFIGEAFGEVVSEKIEEARAE